MTFTIGDLLLTGTAGVLAGILLSPSNRLRPAADRPMAILISAIIEPIYYWCDLKGSDGRPSNSKVAYFLVLLVALWTLLLFARHEHAARQANAAVDVGWGFIGYAALVFALGLGKQTFNAVFTFIAARFPGSTPRLSGAHAAPPPPGGP